MKNCSINKLFWRYIVAKINYFPAGSGKKNANKPATK